MVESIDLATCKIGNREIQIRINTYRGVEKKKKTVYQQLQFWDHSPIFSDTPFFPPGIGPSIGVMLTPNWPSKPPVCAVNFKIARIYGCSSQIMGIYR